MIRTKLDKISNKKYKNIFFGKFWYIILAFILAFSLRVFIVEPFQIPSSSMVPTLLIGDHIFVSKLSYGIINPLSKIKPFIIKWSTPKIGEIVVFDAPEYLKYKKNESWIKRVIAVPGQTISIKDSIVHVDGNPYPHINKNKIITYINSSLTSFGSILKEEQAVRITEHISQINHNILFNPLYSNCNIRGNWPLNNKVVYPGLKCEDNKCKILDNYLFVMGDNRGNSADSRFWGALPINMIKAKAIFVWMNVDSSKKLFKIKQFIFPNFRFKRWFSWII